MCPKHLVFAMEASKCCNLICLDFFFLSSICEEETKRKLYNFLKGHRKSVTPIKQTHCSAHTHFFLCFLIEIVNTDYPFVFSLGCHICTAIT